MEDITGNVAMDNFSTSIGYFVRKPTVETKNSKVIFTLRSTTGKLHEEISSLLSGTSIFFWKIRRNISKFSLMGRAAAPNTQAYPLKSPYSMASHTRGS